MWLCRQVLGRALKDLPRAEIVVATKVGRYGPDDFDFSRARVTASVRESLQRLQARTPRGPSLCSVNLSGACGQQWSW